MVNNHYARKPRLDITGLFIMSSLEYRAVVYSGAKDRATFIDRLGACFEDKVRVGLALLDNQSIFL